MAALSANTVVVVSPYTTPPASATPFGPPSTIFELTRYSHCSFPVARASAYTLSPRSCR
ncbi:MAG TPA: hypothetical protein VHO07_24515 [Streptosporangiaceae bacterium]|nr:hypothetical protein [Streptosporangiaceae bacterium]